MLFSEIFCLLNLLSTLPFIRSHPVCCPPTITVLDSCFVFFKTGRMKSWKPVLRWQLAASDKIALYHCCNQTSQWRLKPCCPHVAEGASESDKHQICMMLGDKNRSCDVILCYTLYTEGYGTNSRNLLHYILDHIFF